MRRTDKLVHKLFTAVSCGPKSVESDARVIAEDGLPIHAMAMHDATFFFGFLGRFASSP
jgi:hypothetical protein